MLGTRGGILILWDDNVVDCANFVLGEWFISADVTIKECSTNFRLTAVYGPTKHRALQQFSEELRTLRPNPNTRWLILGDFNLIYKASDKNNNKINHRLMQQFRDALDDCDLLEIHLQNHKFTWSNE